MKEKILEVAKKMENIANNYGYRKMETAYFLLVQFGIDEMENMSEEKIKEIDDFLVNYDDDIYKQDVVNEISDIVESEE